MQCAQIRSALQGIPGLTHGPLGALMGPASNHRCHYCVDNRARSWDHIVPRARGGPDTRENLVPSCVSCNQAKADGRGKCRCEKCRTAWKRWGEDEGSCTPVT